MGLGGCSIMPKPLTLNEQQELLQQDRVKAASQVEPVVVT